LPTGLLIAMRSSSSIAVVAPLDWILLLGDDLQRLAGLAVDALDVGAGDVDLDVGGPRARRGRDRQRDRGGERRLAERERHRDFPNGCM
jgi:hypothetical protein